MLFHLAVTAAALAAAFAHTSDQVVATTQTEPQESLLPSDPPAESQMEMFANEQGVFSERFSSKFIDEARSPDFAPCFEASSHWDECGTRASKYPRGGLHCPSNLCCSNVAIKNFQKGGWCNQGFFFCGIGGLSYNRNYSYGTCNCSNFSKHCPPNSTCQTGNFNGRRFPYCRCNVGFEAKSGGICVKKTTTTTTPKPKPKSKCNVDDCRPGFCNEFNGRVRCQCIGGYILTPENHGDTCQKPKK